MKKQLKENLKIYLLVLLISALCFGRYLFLNKGLMIFYGDPFEINLKLWQGGWQAVHDGTMGQFCWSLGLGANTFSYIFYFLSSPFFWLSCLLPYSFIPYSFLLFQILNMTFGFVLTDLWLKKVSKSRLGSLAGAFVINFSAYVFFYTQASQLEYLFILYPLILLFTESFIQERKWKGLVLSTALAGLWNYYLLYMLVPFLCVYTILRYLLVHREEPIGQVLKSALKYAGCLLLGVGMAAIVMVPCGYLVLSMPRFTSGAESYGRFLTKRQMFRILTSALLPAFEKLDANPLINASKVSAYGWSGGCSLYALVLPLILMPYVFRLKDKREKYFTLLFGGILLVFLAFPVFSYLFQMTVDTRWYYMFPFYAGMVCSRVIKGLETEELSGEDAKRNFFVVLVIYVLAIAVAFAYKLNTLHRLAMAIMVSGTMLVLALAYTQWIQKSRNPKKLLALLSLEAVFAGTVFGYRNGPVPAFILQDPILNQPVNNVLKQLEPQDSFYRVQYDNHQIVTKEEDGYPIETFAYMTGNEPYANGYKGFGFYESLYNTNQEKYLQRLKSTWNMTQMVGRTRTYNMLSSKYWYTYDHSDDVPYGYDYVGTYENGLELYKNRNYVELGYAYENCVTPAALEGMSFLQQDLLMSEYLVKDSADTRYYHLRNNVRLLETLSADDVRVYDFEEPFENSILYIENYGIPEVKIKMYYKEELVKSYDIWQFNYIDLVVEEAIDRIVLEAPNIYGAPTNVLLYGEKIDGSLDERFAEITKDHFTNVKAKNDVIEADIEITDHDKTVFTSIPYDQGWSVYVDGQKTNYESVQLGFVGFELSEGAHHVRFEYHTPGLKAGTFISLGALALFIILCFRSKK